MDRTEWPTEAKIAELRRDGVVPYSFCTVRAAGALGVLLGLFLVREKIASIIDRYPELLNVENIDDPLVSEMGREVFTVVLAPSLAVASTIILVGLGQTKFLLLFSRLGFLIGRLNPFRMPDLSRILFRLGETILVAVMAVLVGMLAVRLSSREVLSLLNQDRATFLQWPSESIVFVVPLLVGLLGLLGFATYLIERFRFLLRNRMTREELLAEETDRW